jgi:ABC-2 type transport system permease protein
MPPLSSNTANDFIPPVGGLLSQEREAQIFWRLRTHTTVSTLRWMLTSAWLRAILVASLSLFFWGGLYVLFYYGFGFLSSASIHTDVVEPLYNAFFLALMVMLVFSSGIIMYSGLFCSPEAVFLLTTPVRTQRIYQHKFQEAVWFSSWGFVLLGSPTLVAYGVAASAPWYYYALLLPFVIAFVHIPAAVGGILCLLIVNWTPSVRIHALALSLIAAMASVVWVIWTIASGAESNLLTPDWFTEAISRLRFTEQRLLPSWWLSAGLLEASRDPYIVHVGDPPWAESLKFLALLVSYALVLNLLANWLAGRVYRSSYSRLYDEPIVHRRANSWWVDTVLAHGAVFLPRAVRMLLIKDFRIFRRDPIQWSQFLIFFGLLGLYFINIRRFSYNSTYSAMIGFLNLAVVGLILSTFTTRFIFPMVSLEGRRLWILGLLPVSRDSILWSKFLFAGLGSLIPCTSLVFLSDFMLQIADPVIYVAHQISCVALCVGLSGIAVGLGARMPDLRAHSPSKIAAGFGGTLNLVISAAYIVIIVMLTALPVHFRSTPSEGLTFLEQVIGYLGTPAGIATGIGLTALTAALATVWPMWIGLRAFRKLEI